jgi:hypothetical protein
MLWFLFGMGVGLAVAIVFIVGILCWAARED